MLQGIFQMEKVENMHAKTKLTAWRKLIGENSYTNPHIMFTNIVNMICELIISLVSRLKAQ